MAKKPATPKPGDFALRADGVPDQRRLELVAARAIVAVTTRPDVPMTAEAIAEAAGLSTVVVVEMLASPEFRDLISTEIRARVSGIINQGLTMLGQVIGDPTKAPTVRIAAHQAAVRTYEVMAKAAPQHNALDAESNAEQFIKSLQASSLSRLKVSEARIVEPHASP